MTRTARAPALWGRALLALALSPLGPAVREAPRPTLRALHRMPLAFAPNRGQAGAGVKFVARGPDGSILLAGDEAVMALGGSVVKMRFVGANAAATATGLEGLSGKVNYLLGNDPSRWRTNLPTYAKVAFREVYPGIDVVYYQTQGKLEYDLVLAPGAEVSEVILAFEGARRIEIDDRGDLVLDTDRGEVRLAKPLAYQEVDGDRREVAACFARAGDERVSFRVAGHDHDRPLVIDPKVVFSTFLGGNRSDNCTCMAMDAAGNIYLAGGSLSDDFPLKKPLQGERKSFQWDAFVMKLTPDGSTPVYSTFLGGVDLDLVTGIAVDASGCACVVGRTESSTFPTVRAFQARAGGGRDVFVAKLNPEGSALVFSTYLGGSHEEDWGIRIALDHAGRAVVTGRTFSGDFPVVRAVQASLKGPVDAFVTKLDADGSLIYSTYLGGSGDDGGNAVAVDARGNAYVAGYTHSTDFPTTHPYAPAVVGGTKTFVTKLNAAGAVLVYSTCLAGKQGAKPLSLAVDASGCAYVAGYGRSDFPTTAGAFQPRYGGGRNDAFVAKLDPTGSAVVYSSFLGGAAHDACAGIVLDGAGNAFLTGHTYSKDFPTTRDAHQPAFGGGEHDAFVAVVDPTGSALVYSTFLGGRNHDGCGGIAVDRQGNAFVGGGSDSADFPTVNPIQADRAGGYDLTLTRFLALGPGNASTSPVPAAIVARARADAARADPPPATLASRPPPWIDDCCRRRARR